MGVLALVHALGWSLLHFLWQGTVVAILLACVLELLRGQSSALRYGVSCCALAVMAVLPVVTFGWLVVHLRAAGSLISTSTVTGVSHVDVQRGWKGAGEPWLEVLARTLDPFVPWMLAVWLAGVTLLLGRLQVGLVAVHRMWAATVDPISAELRVLFEALSLRMGVARVVRLAHSARVEAPVVLGWLRPVILIPVGCFAGLSVAQVEAVLAHELAHVRRHDALVSLLQSVVETLLFYHPAVWWVSRHVRREREHCCDDLAVKMSGDGVAYARALSLLEERRAFQPAVALGANGGVLTMRIRRLLGQDELPMVSRMAVFTLLALVLAAAGLCLDVVARAQTDGAGVAAESQQEQALPMSYRKWLDTDVCWIIAPEERSAFLKLPDNAERDAFIEQFWERRNPVPGSAENKTRDEHYRRIAYANQHFSAGIPGWETDRGHVYIVNGPPDSIDSYPSGNGGGTEPFEIWYYRSARVNDVSGNPAKVETRTNVSIKFVDTCRCGKYELQPSTGN